MVITTILAKFHLPTITILVDLLCKVCQYVSAQMFLDNNPPSFPLSFVLYGNS